MKQLSKKQAGNIIDEMKHNVQVLQAKLPLTKHRTEKNMVYRQIATRQELIKSLNKTYFQQPAEAVK